MNSSLKPEEEQKRLKELADLNILDSKLDPSFEKLTELITGICEARGAMISFIDDQMQWVKASSGLDIKDIPKDKSYCPKVIQAGGVVEIADCSTDEDFKGNPLLTLDPPICFYAGCAIKLANGHKIGVLSVVDTKARTLNNFQRESLKVLSDQAAHLLNLESMKQTEEKRQELEQALLKSAAYNHEISSYLTILMLSLDIHIKEIPEKFYDSTMASLDKVSDKLRQIKKLVQEFVSPDEQFTKDVEALRLIPTEEQEKDSDHYQVLLVEDDHEQREFLAEVIEYKSSRQLIVTAVEDGSKAIEKANEIKFDIIVTDFDLPKTDGVTFINACRAGGKNLDTPIIFTSGGMSLVDTDKLLHQTPGLSILEKPFKIEQLIELMETSFASQLTHPLPPTGSE